MRIRVSDGDLPGAALLAGVADRLLEETCTPLQGEEQALFDQAKEAAEEQLGTAAYGAAHGEGEATDSGEALVRSDLLEEAALTRAAG